MDPCLRPPGEGAVIMTLFVMMLGKVSDIKIAKKINRDVKSLQKSNMNRGTQNQQFTLLMNLFTGKDQNSNFVSLNQ